MPTKLETKLTDIEATMKWAGKDLCRLPNTSPSYTVLYKVIQAMNDLTEVVRGLMPENNT